MPPGGPSADSAVRTSPRTPRAADGPQVTLRRGTVPLIAACCGVTVANIYLAYPILTLIAGQFGIGEATSGLIVTVAQVSYAFGLFFLVPLGDVVRRRRLLTTLVVGSGAGLALASRAGDFAGLAAATVALSTLTVAPHVLLPFVVSSVPRHRQGRALATINAGMTAGIVLSRVGGGAIGDFFGWHAVYAVAAVLTVAVGLLTAFILPTEPVRPRIRYRRLIGSTVRYLRDEPRLRWAVGIQIPVFATFILIWSMLVFLLTGPVYDYSVAAAGLFGLFSLATMLSAPVVGRLLDRYGSATLIGYFLAILLAGTVVLQYSRVSIWAVVTGIVLLNLGQQGTAICNQTRVLNLHPEARSRINTLYQTSNFIGGSLASVLATGVYALWGWSGVTTASLVSAGLAMTMWSVDAALTRRAGRRTLTAGARGRHAGLTARAR